MADGKFIERSGARVLGRLFSYNAINPVLMKRLFLICTSLLLALSAFPQTGTSVATVSYVLGMGADETCVTSHGHTTTTEKDGFRMMRYVGSSDSLANFPTSSAVCSPTFPTWASKLYNGSPGPTQIWNSSIAYNPSDLNEYYYTVNDTTIAGVSTTNTYMWKWPVGSCPTGTLMPTAEFTNTDLLTTFDNSGNSWAVNFIYNSGSGTYTLALQKITTVGSTVTLGPMDPIVLSAGTPAITTANGDFVFTPSGNMFLVVNNEEIAIDYQAYTASTINIAGTYVGTIAVPAGDYLVGLAYAAGSFIGAISPGGLTCSPIYEQINMLTGATTSVKYPGGFNSNDNGNLTSGVGAAKSLVSLTPTGVANEYTVVYNVFVKNYGNFPVANIQAYDNLSAVAGGANMKNISLAFVGTPPPASYNINLNPSYNGLTNDSLLQTGGTLFNYPVANANFTIQITVTFDNIVAGKVYYNQAVASGNGFNMDVLTDTSTNGNNPDLNDNDKPDDPGEDIPTPFIVELAAQSAPCATLPQVLFSETFGTSATGTQLKTALPAGGTTQYTGTTTTPVAVNDYAISQNANNGNTANWISLTDHTTGTGDMMLVNADLGTNIVYQAQVQNLCQNLKYSFNAYVANISDTTAISFCNAVGGFQPPSLVFQMVDAGTGLTLASLATGNIWAHTWTSYGMRLALPATSGTVNLQIVNAGGGGCGNDFALDDISFGLCNAAPSVVIDGSHAGCLDSSTTLLASLANGSVFNGSISYVWQDSVAGGAWTNIYGANDSTYTIGVVSDTTPVYYRVNVATPGNNQSICSYTSNTFVLVLKSHPSTAPLLLTKSADETCTLVPITLTESGGTLGDGASYYWSNNKCNGDTIGITSGTTLSVTPSVTTTYWVSAVGACNTTSCASVTVNVVCVLPTDLVYFRGSISSDEVTLTWDVTDNQNLTGFYIERSLDGVNYTVIDSVSSTGEDGEVSYSLGDNVASLHVQTITYRLQLRFKGGNTMESQVVAVNKPLTQAEGIIVYPNPASHQLSIAINSDKQQQLSYTVINMQGQVLLTGAQVLTRGPNTVNVNDLEVLTSGAYIVRIQLQDAVVQKKVIIQK